MESTARRVVTKGLAIAGTILVWLPIVAPLVFSVSRFARVRALHVDYLMPAELFPVALVGGVALFAAALLARSHRALIGGSLAAAVGLLLAGMVLAVVTGLASGATEPTGWPVVLVASTLVAYTIGLVVMGVAGAALLRGLFANEEGAS